MGIILPNPPTEARDNWQYRRDILQAAEHSKEVQVACIERCKNDIVFYFNTFAWQYNGKAREKVGPFTLYPFQVDVAHWMVDAILNHEEETERLLKKSKDIGITWLTLGVLDWCCLWHDWMSGVIASKDESLVDKPGDPGSLFWRLDFMHDNLPAWMGHTFERTRLHIGYTKTNSVIDGSSTNKQLSRGHKRTFLFLDENAFMPNGHAINAATSDSAKVRIKVSTPNGPITSFFTDERKFLSEGNSDWVRRVHWSEHPVKSRGLYSVDDSGRVTYLDADFWTPERQLAIDVVNVKPRSPHYAFRSPWYDHRCQKAGSEIEIASELDLFDEGAQDLFYDPSEIGKLMLFCKEPKVGQLLYTADGKPDKWIDAESPGVKFELWCEFNNDGRPPKDRRYGIGVDVSGGMGRTISAISVVDFKSNEKVASVTTAILRPDQLAILASAVGHFFSDPEGQPAIINLEMAGPGGAFRAGLLELGYHTMWRNNKVNSEGNTVLAKEFGYMPSGPNKRHMHECYRRMLYTRAFRNYDREALRECLEYIIMSDGERIDHISTQDRSLAPSQAKVNHGDRCVADCLAILVLPATYHKEESEDVKRMREDDYPVGSIAREIRDTQRREAMTAYG